MTTDTFCRRWAGRTAVSAAPPPHDAPVGQDPHDGQRTVRLIHGAPDASGGWPCHAAKARLRNWNLDHRARSVSTGLDCCGRAIRGTSIASDAVCAGLDKPATPQLVRLRTVPPAGTECHGPRTVRVGPPPHERPLEGPLSARQWPGRITGADKPSAAIHPPPRAPHLRSVRSGSTTAIQHSNNRLTAV